MRCIIVDDEPKARKVLQKLIEIHCPLIEVVALCENLSEARMMLLEKDPDLVFLDIHLPNELGLDLVQNISNRRFAFILTTAHEGYAIKAFENNAQDYLLKPIYSGRLLEAIEKAEHYLSKNGKTTNNLIGKTVIDKVPIPIEDGIEMIDVESIIRIEASGSYCKIHLVEKKSLLISKHMKVLEQLLKGKPFYRIHNSHLINLNHLKKVQRTDGGFAIMSDDKSIEISRRKLSGFVKYLDQSNY